MTGAKGCRQTHSAWDGTSSQGLTAQKSDSEDRQMPCKGPLPPSGSRTAMPEAQVCLLWTSPQGSSEQPSRSRAREEAPGSEAQPQGREWPPGGSRGPGSQVSGTAEPPRHPPLPTTAGGTSGFHPPSLGVFFPNWSSHRNFCSNNNNTATAPMSRAPTTCDSGPRLIHVSHL